LLVFEIFEKKFIARVWVGLDKVDLEETKKRNIKVLNTPWANANSVADLVLAGILSMTRNLQKGFLWLEKRFDYMWEELFNKSVWIVGFWNIWKKVYNRFKAFWVEKFYIFDPFLKKEDVEKNDFCEFVEDKKYIFQKSDIISFHIPLLPQTKNFLWKQDFPLLKKEVFLVNTSRWWIIDEIELIKFLKNNKNAKFFADVWEEENNTPLLSSPLKGERNNMWPKKELLELENVLITPHIWAMTKEAEEKMHYFKGLV